MVKIILNEEEQVDSEGMGEIPQGVPPPMPNNPDENFYKYRINGNDILTTLKYQLMGYVFDEEKQMLDKKFDAWLNEEGINIVLSSLYATGLNKGAFLGNLEKREILHKCKMLKIKLAREFAFDYAKYGLLANRRSLLITSIINPVHSGLSRSEGGLEARQVSSATNMHYLYTDNNNQKKEGMMGGLFRNKN